jgi:hypothetical protein
MIEGIEILTDEHCECHDALCRFFINDRPVSPEVVAEFKRHLKSLMEKGQVEKKPVKPFHIVKRTYGDDTFSFNIIEKENGEDKGCFSTIEEAREHLKELMAEIVVREEIVKDEEEVTKEEIVE